LRALDALMKSTPTSILPDVPAYRAPPPASYEEEPAPIPIPKIVRARPAAAPVPDREMDLRAPDPAPAAETEPATASEPEPAPAAKVATAAPPPERVPNNVIVFPGSPKPAAPVRRSVRAAPLVNDITGGRLDPNEIQKIPPRRIQNVWY
jgi:hypothetical protein